MRKKEKIKLLEYEATNLTLKLTNLKNENVNLIKYMELMETTLKSTSNELTGANKTIEEQKTEIMLLKKEILKKEQLIEIKENQRRKSAGKVGDLTKKIKKLQDEKEGQN